MKAGETLSGFFGYGRSEETLRRRGPAARRSGARAEETTALLQRTSSDPSMRTGAFESDLVRKTSEPLSVPTLALAGADIELPLRYSTYRAAGDAPEREIAFTSTHDANDVRDRLDRALANEGARIGAPVHEAYRRMGESEPYRGAFVGRYNHWFVLVGLKHGPQTDLHRVQMHDAAPSGITIGEPIRNVRPEEFAAVESAVRRAVDVARSGA